MENQVVFEKLLGRPEGNGCRGSDSDYCGKPERCFFSVFCVEIRAFIKKIDDKLR